jgi:hypothetical protein
MAVYVEKDVFLMSDVHLMPHDRKLHILNWDQTLIKVDLVVHNWYTQELPKLVEAPERMKKLKTIPIISIVAM